MCPEADFPVFSPGIRGEDGESRHILLHDRRLAWAEVNDSALRIAQDLRHGVPGERIARGIADAHAISYATALQQVALTEQQLRAAMLLDPPNAGPQTPRRLTRLCVEVTNRCNLRCPHCYAECGTAGLPGSDLSFEGFCGMLDEFVRLRGRRITLTGGEPLIHPRFRELVQRCREAAVEISVLTNGVAVDSGWAGFLADNADSVQVSLDGSTPEIHDRIRGTGSFARSCAAIERLRAAGVRELATSTTIMGHNVHDLMDILVLTERLGVSAAHFKPVCHVGSAAAHWSWISIEGVREAVAEFFRQVVRIRLERRLSVNAVCDLGGVVIPVAPRALDQGGHPSCDVGRALYILGDGTISACSFLPPEYARLGNIATDSLEAVMCSEQMANACRIVQERKAAAPACRVCPWRGICQGGCAGRAWDVSGSRLGTDEFCEYRDWFYRENFTRILEASA